MFEKVKAAIAAIEAAENTYESKLESNATAQDALVNAQGTAATAAGALVDARTALKSAGDTLTAEIAAFESSL